MYDMDQRYRIEYVCPDCKAEFQITCPESPELCQCGAVLVPASSLPGPY